MKKLYFLLSALAFGTSLSAQIVFSEDFDGIGGATAGGAGTYSFPSGWLKVNVDNRTPATSVAYVNEAWERREDFSFNVADSCAFSTSWYTPAGAADDWMWTPAISTLPSNCILNWNAVTYDASYRDGYEVRIMVSPNTPTGSTGNLGNMVSASTVLFSTTAEATTWTAHQVSLAAYAGQTVRIGFRNNSTDKFLLLIDDVVVQQQVFADPELVSYTRPSDYFRTPLQQQPSYPLSATIRNNGMNSITNTMLTANVYDASNTLVYTSNSATTTLASGASATFTASPFVPTVTGAYRIEYNATASSDDIMTNNLKLDSVMVTDSTYGRDRGATTGGLGIGAGNGGFLGQHYVLTQGAELTSVDIFLATPVNNMHMGVAIFDMVNGNPGTALYTSPNMAINTTTPGWFHFQLAPGTLILPADTVVVEAVEVDSTLSVGLTNEWFTNNSTWVDWPTNPVNPWGNNEDYGSSFAKSYMIRPNFGDPCASLMATSSNTPATCGVCADGSASVTVSGGSPGYTYSWAPTGGTSATASSLTPGSYTVTITDNGGCIHMDTIVVPNNCTSYSIALDSLDASCGSCNDGTAMVTVTNGLAPYTILWSNGDTTMTNDSLMPGTYTVTVTDASGCSTTDSIVVTFSTSTGSLQNTSAMSAFPNPNNGTFELNIRFEKATDADIEIFNVLGNRVFASHLESVVNENIPVDLGEQAAGHYIVRLRTAEGLRMLPVIVR